MEEAQEKMLADASMQEYVYKKEHDKKMREKS
jgi:hypothetical protein